MSRLWPGRRVNRFELRRTIVCAMLCAAASLALGSIDAAGSELSEADWSAIKNVISQQLEALKRGEGERAFAYASEGIRAQFGDAENFLTMVRTGYSALLDARYTEFLEGAMIDGVIVQPLRLVAPDNTVRVALYTMERYQGGWRINGCAIAPSTVKAA